MTEPTRQLPGVKGQWILAADCPPIKADGDNQGDVLIAFSSHWDYAEWHEVKNYQYWSPSFINDPRPFALPAAPAPEQAASTERLFDKIAQGGGCVYAVADDGTAWVSPVYELHGVWAWEQIEPLPLRDA